MNLPSHISSPNPDIYNSGSYVVLDFETTNKDKGSAVNEDNSLVLTVWKTPTKKKVSWASEYELQELVDDIYAHDFLVCHNAKFELQWLARCGLDLTKVVVFDTMLAEWVLLGNRSKPINLNDTCSRYGLPGKEGPAGAMIKAGVCPSEIPESLLQKYCVKDVEITELLFLKQKKRLSIRKQMGILYTRCLLAPCLADMEFYGMALDGERVKEEYNKAALRYQELSKKIDELTGGINWRSTKQVAEFLYDELGFEEPKNRAGDPIRTPAGNRKADADTINGLKAKNKRQKQFIEFKRELNKLNAMLTKNLEFFMGIVEEKGGILRAEFNQGRTGTHRLSSSGVPTQFELFPKPKSVQFQNLPRQFKRLLCSRYSGWKVGEVDGAQLEFRVAAYAGQDAQAIQDIREGNDIHRFSADVLGVSRQDAKADTFKPLYGGKSGTKKQVAYYKAFQEKYNELHQTQEGWVNEVVNTKMLKLPWGMVFFWPNVKMSYSGYVLDTPSIYNYPIQSLATAEIIPIAHIYLWHMLKACEAKSFLVNTVHDSSIAEIHPKEIELFHELAVKAYTDHVYEYLYTVYGVKFNVRLGAEVGIGDHWNEGDETKYSSVPPFEEVA